MGASGAGKTTLLNILSCRIKCNPDGRFTANNLEYDESNFGNFANYVTQHDVLMETLTVRQTLEFAARLKLNLDEDQRKKQVVRLAQSMKLQKCLDTLVGGLLVKGVSGGQKKRISIAIELISDPQVIFLDQPTSGLDSLTSYIICSELRKLAKNKNKTVIMTIHQPNSQTYKLFDELVLLLEGRLIYHDDSNQVTNYFQKNFGLVCPEFSNPPDFFMSKIHHESLQNVKLYPKYFDAFQKNQIESVNLKIQWKITSEVRLRQVNTGFMQAILALSNRCFINMHRNPMLARTKIIQSIALGLFLGGMFFNLGSKNYLERTNEIMIFGLLFFISTQVVVMSVSPVVLSFPMERDVVFKEQDSKMYNSLQYLLVQNIVELPELIITAMISTIAYYFMVGLGKTVEQFFIHYLIFFLLSFYGSSTGLMLGSIVDDAKAGSALVVMVVLTGIQFSGYTKNRLDLPKWCGWLEYLSPIKYGFISFAENEMKYKESNIQNLNFELTMWESIIVLFCLGIFVRIWCFFFLWWIKVRSRK